MESTKDLNRKGYILILSTTVSLILYIITIKDWFVIYEIFFAIPLFLTSIGSIGLFLIITLQIFEKKTMPSPFLMMAFSLVAIVFLSIYAYRNGLFWSEKLDAAFIGERSRMDLTLYNNGNYIIYSNWMFGEERFEGKYKIDGDTLIFLNSPVTDNDFVNNKSLINLKEKKIYFNKTLNGNYDKEDYFRIDY